MKKNNRINSDAMQGNIPWPPESLLKPIGLSSEDFLHQGIPLMEQVISLGQMIGQMNSDIIGLKPELGLNTTIIDLNTITFSLKPELQLINFEISLRPIGVILCEPIARIPRVRRRKRRAFFWLNFMRLPITRR